MGVEDLFRIAGQVAGIGGLAICLFLLIARSVLKTVPPPGATPAKGYLKLIDKILLYAFILSIAGLMIYAVSRFIELSNLVSENYQLREKIKRISDPTLKLNSAAFEVWSCEVKFDLTEWHKVSSEELRTMKRSEQVTTNTRWIWRAHQEAEKFSGGTFGTDSPFEPNITCLSPKYTLNQIENFDRLQGGKDSGRRWNLEYDVKDAPLFEPFEIVTKTTAWNTLQNSNEGHEGSLIRIPTRKLTLIVKFPKERLPHKDGFTLKTMPLLDPASAAISQEGKLTIAPDLSYVKWEIDQPKLGYHYLIYWQW